MMLLGGWVFSLFMGLFITLFVIVSLLLILIVLIQKGRGGGLASAFGGGGGNTAFGSKTGDVLTWATSVIFGVFLVLAIVLNLMARPATTVAAGPRGGNPQQPVQTPVPTPTQNIPTTRPATVPSLTPAATTPTTATTTGATTRPSATQPK